MTETLEHYSKFLLQLDALKLVNRRSYISGGERVENSAEHSLHLAIACWGFAELLDDSYDMAKLIKLALVHDLGEIGAGDTFLYSEQRENAHLAERQSVKELAAHSGNPLADLLDLWEEQETGASKETKLLKVIDRLLPFLHNINSGGRAWVENNICRSQVAGMHQFIEKDFPEIHAWLSEKIADAVQRGWLRDA